ncbi:hypothetical protein [Rhodococcus tukisamuensis]|nr:hypothetical protein [Rhodococcus tukisamuensis]
MNTTVVRTDGTERAEIIGQADTLWRRAGVRGVDRRVLLAELEIELRDSHPDDHGMTPFPGEESVRMLRERANRRGMCGRALRLELVVPAAVLGIVAGAALPLLVLLSVLSPLSAIHVGQYERLLHVSSGILGYLGALLLAWRVLHNYGDPRATSTVWWLAVLLPVGAALGAGVGVAVTRWRNFDAPPAVFGVAGVVAVGLVLAVGISRLLAARPASE